MRAFSNARGPSQSYDDLIAADLLPTGSNSTESTTVFSEDYQNNTTAKIEPSLASFGRKRSVSQGITLGSQQYQNSDKDDAIEIWNYDSNGIDSLLGSLKLNSRERAESDFAQYKSMTSKPSVETKVKLAQPQEEPQRLSPLMTQRRGNRKDDWLCLVCGNKNYSWRHVCNMRKCRAPRPGQLTESPPTGSWPCLSCGNLNYAERVVCNMRKCRTPRVSPPMYAGYQFPVGVSQYPQPQFANPSHHYSSVMAHPQPQPQGFQVHAHQNVDAMPVGTVQKVYKEYRK